MVTELTHIAVVGAVDCVELPAGVAKGGHAAGKYVVVDEASEDGEYSHQQDDVATTEEGLKDLTAVVLGELLLVNDKQKGGQEHQEAVPDVSKHDGKQEREGDDGEGGGVNLAIGPNTVRINDGLQRKRGKVRRLTLMA